MFAIIRHIRFMRSIRQENETVRAQVQDADQRMIDAINRFTAVMDAYREDE